MSFRISAFPCLTNVLQTKTKHHVLITKIFHLSSKMMGRPRGPTGAHSVDRGFARLPLSKPLYHQSENPNS